MFELTVPDLYAWYLSTWCDVIKYGQWQIKDFPEEGVPTLQGAPTYDFAKFSQKLHEIERIWTPRGGRASKILLDYVDPPLVALNFEPHYEFLWHH